MTTHYRTQGFVFGRQDRREADRIFSLFTQDFGKIEVTARAIRKIASKLKGGIDLFSFSTIEFVQGQKRNTLIDAVAVRSLPSLQEVPEKLVIASDAALILQSLLIGQESDQKLWQFVVDFFEKLDGVLLSPTNQGLWYSYFFWNVISILGYEPELSKCTVCLKPLNPRELYFSYQDGGMISDGCALAGKEVKKINSDTVKLLRLIIKKEWDLLSKLKIDMPSLALLQDLSASYWYYLRQAHGIIT